MKKQLLLGLGLIVASPLLLAQNSSNSRDQNQNTKTTTPATPAVPATPALPASPSSNSDDTGIEGPTTDEDGTTSGSARTKGAGVGAAGNPNSGHGRVEGRGASDFGTLDVNGDGRLSQEEVKASTGIAGQFTQMDSNSDGALSRAEFGAGGRATPKNGGASTSSSSKNRTEGSDKTNKDDDLDRKLKGD
jgi:hypothetical protein